MSFLSGWNYRKSFVVDNGGLGSGTNVQVRLLLHAANFDFSKALSTGNDIRVTTSDGTTLCNIWRRSWSQTNSMGEVWVNVPTFSTNTTTLYLYWGNSSASDVSSYSSTMTKFVSDANTLALLHFDEGTGTPVDTGPNAYTVTPVATPTWVTTDGGNFDNSSTVQSFATGACLSLNGTSQYVKVATVLDTAPTNGTIEFWFKFNTSIPTSTVRLVSKVATQSPTYNSVEIYWLFSSGAGSMVLNVQKANSAQTATSITRSWVVGRWYHVVGTWGSGGMRLYVNGIEEGRNSSTQTYNSGTANPLHIGVLGVDGTVSQFANATFDELRVLNRAISRDEVIADFQRRKYVAGSNQHAKLTKFGSTIIAPSVAWEAAAIYEPTALMMDATTMAVYYSGGWTNAAIGLATTTDGTTLTKYASNPVIGQGAGGESGLAARSCAIKVGSTYRIYYANANPLADIRLATSSDGMTFSRSATVVLSKSAVTGVTGWANTAVFNDGTTWHMLAEGFHTVAPQWRMYYFTSSDGGLTFNLVSGPLNSLQVASGVTGGPSLTKIGSVYHLWYHYTTQPGVPSYCAHAISADMINWHIVTLDTMLELAGETLGLSKPDQVADPSYIEAFGKVGMYYDLTDNTNSAGKITVTQFTGTTDQLLADTPSITYGTQETSVIRRMGNRRLFQVNRL